MGNDRFVGSRHGARGGHHLVTVVRDRQQMKILVTHPRQWASSPLQKELGVEVRHVSIGGSLPRRLDGSLSFDGIGEVATEKGLAELIRVAGEFQPDVFLFGIHFEFPGEVLKKMRHVSTGTKFAMHYTDQRESVPRQVRLYQGLLDLFLVTNKDPADHARYKSFGILPVKTFYDGVDLGEYHPKAVVPEFDCYFGGNNFYGLDLELQKRKVTLAQMLSKFPGSHYRQEFLNLVNDRFRLLIRGQWGWDKSAFNVKPALFCPHEVNGMLEAKIILSTFNIKFEGLITRRIFRSLASGRMLLTERCSGLEEYFQNHRHLVWFETPEEGLDLIRYYLEHPTERDRIAAAGLDLVRRHHTFDSRLREFVNIAREVFE